MARHLSDLILAGPEVSTLSLDQLRVVRDGMCAGERRPRVVFCHCRDDYEEIARLAGIDLDPLSTPALTSVPVRFDAEIPPGTWFVAYEPSIPDAPED